MIRLRISVFAIGLIFAANNVSHAEPAVDPYGILLKPIPEKLIVLSFDDSCASHATFVGPVLKKYGFGGTFYVSDAFMFRTRKDWYMTWEQIKALQDMGFEIGNHTLGHGQLSATGIDGCTRGLIGIEEECLANHVAKPTTFCWPFYSVNNRFFKVLSQHGYQFARGGGERAYQPTRDCPFDIPSFTFHDPALAKKDSFANVVKQATGGKIVVITFHGVPDMEHPAIGVEQPQFEELMKYLKENGFKVIAMRDLAEYIDAPKAAQLLGYPRALPWGGRSPQWGGITREGNRLYLCADHLPADRKLTVPDMTTRISQASFLADGAKKPLEIVRSQTGIQTVVVPEFSPETFGQNPTVIVAELQGGPIATVLDFVFSGLPEPTIAGNEIRVNVPLATDLTRLAPLYHTGSPLVTGSPASGSTQDFTKPKTYTITAPDGSTRQYVVTVVPTRGVVGVSNPSFERFDVLDEFEDTLGKNPAGTTWTFKQSKPGDEVGIAHLAGPITAAPSPDGTNHVAFIRGKGNAISQPIAFDAGNYTVSFDIVRRRGYSKISTPLVVTIDDAPVLKLDSPDITEAWKHCTSPPFTVTAGVHTLAFTLGEGDGMDLIDNVTVSAAK